MFLPIHTDRPLRHTPSVNIGLIAANVVVYVLQLRFPALEAALLLRPQEPTLLGFFGSAFLHGGIMHLLGNMLFLFIFGNSINDRLGNAAYLAFYLAGALAAGLLHVAVDDSPVLGASGAVSAVTGAYLVLFPRSRVAVLILLFVITTAWIPSLWLIGLYFAFDLFLGLAGADGGVARFAHVGGSVFGAGVSLLLLSTRLVPRDETDVLALLRRRRLRREHAAALRAGGQTHARATDVVPATDAEAEARLSQIQDLRARIGVALERDNLREAARLYGTLARLDEDQVLSMQGQLDVANQLFADGRHAEAAGAYERFLRRYHKQDEVARAQLMLGLTYSRYLDRPEQARAHLLTSLPRLDADDADVARRELASLSAGVA